MVIYHLVGHVTANKYGELWKGWCYFSDVFPTLALAIEAGVKEVKERIDRLLKEDTEFEESELAEFIKDCIDYKFTVYEFDPAREKDKQLRTDVENISLENSVEFSDRIEWKYNHKGKLIYRMEFRVSGFEIMPEDYAEDADVHFKKGDLVTLKPSARKIATGTCVVSCVPGRRQQTRDPLYWENIYTVHYLYNDDEYSVACHDHPHESLIELYQGELPKDSFLYVLSEFFKGERQVNKEI